MDSKEHPPPPLSSSGGAAPTTNNNDLSAPVIIDLAFDREFDPALDGPSNRAGRPAAPATTNAAPRSPVAVRIKPDGSTVPAPDFAMPSPAAIALVPLNVNGHATNGHTVAANGAPNTTTNASITASATPKTPAKPAKRTLADIGLGPDEFGRVRLSIVTP